MTARVPWTCRTCQLTGITTATCVNCGRQADRDQSGERRMVRRIIRALRAAGWTATRVDDGGDSDVVVTGEQTAIDAVFAVDVATVYFARIADIAQREQAIVFVLGNADDGSEVAADWTCGVATFDEIVSSVVLE